MTTTVRLPVKHALDWHDRCEAAAGAEIVTMTQRTITLTLTAEALRDLIADATYYAEEMGPANTGDLDYRPAARRCLAALERAGVRWTRRPGTFAIALWHTGWEEAGR